MFKEILDIENCYPLILSINIEHFVESFLLYKIYELAIYYEFDLSLEIRSGIDTNNIMYSWCETEEEKNKLAAIKLFYSYIISLNLYNVLIFIFH